MTRIEVWVDPQNYKKYLITTDLKIVYDLDLESSHSHELTEE